MPSRLSMLYEKQKVLQYLYYVQKTRVMKPSIKYYKRIVKYLQDNLFFCEMPTRLSMLYEKQKVL